MTPWNNNYKHLRTWGELSVAFILVAPQSFKKWPESFSSVITTVASVENSRI